jgi:hypothetical protein
MFSDSDDTSSRDVTPRFISASGSNLLLSSPGRAPVSSVESPLKRADSKVTMIDSYACMESDSGHEDTSATEESNDTEVAKAAKECSEDKSTRTSTTSGETDDSRDASADKDNSSGLLSSSGGFKRETETPSSGDESPREAKEIDYHAQDSSPVLGGGNTSPGGGEGGSRSSRGVGSASGSHHHAHGAPDEPLPSPTFRTKLQSSTAKLADVWFMLYLCCIFV